MELAKRKICFMGTEWFNITGDLQDPTWKALIFKRIYHLYPQSVNLGYGVYEILIALGGGVRHSINEDDIYTNEIADSRFLHEGI